MPRRDVRIGPLEADAPASAAVALVPGGRPAYAPIPTNTMTQASWAGTLPPVGRIDAEPLRFYLLEMDARIMEGSVELQFLR